MSQLLVEFGGRFMDWTTLSNGPLTGLMTLPELRRYVFRGYGFEGLRDLPQRLERVKRFGTSSQMGAGKQSILENNHAGLNGERVTTEAEMVALYGSDDSPIAGQDVLDAAKPLVIKDYGGFANVNYTVTEVVAVRDNMAFVMADDGEGAQFPMLVDLETAQVVNAGCKQLYAENVT